MRAIRMFERTSAKITQQSRHEDLCDAAFNSADTMRLAQKPIFARALLFAASLASASAADGADLDRAIACPFYGNSFGGPNRKAETIDGLIERTQRIVLGLVIGERASEDRWTGADVVFRVQVVSTIKGDDSLEPIEIVGVRSEHLYPVDPYVLDLTFRHGLGLAKADTVYLAGYTSALFGKENRTGAKAVAKCAHVPQLELGMTYLMFLSDPVTEVSFEPIVNFADDPWLNRVRSAVQKREFEQ